MPRQSRYSEFGYKKPPREKRTIRIHGANDDDGMYYKCWHCGFSGNRIDRNTLGDGDGLTYALVPRLDGYGNAPYGDPDAGSSSGYGSPTTVQGSDYQAQVTVKTAGCAFCGCMNYK